MDRQQRESIGGSAALDPFLLMALLFGALATLAALDSALIGAGVLPFWNGLRWVRVHLVTLGLLAELLFGLLPVFFAARAGLPRPTPRWDVWLLLNSGLLVLLIGIPPQQSALIVAGGILILVAIFLLSRQLRLLIAAAVAPELGASLGGRFPLTALGFLLVGVTVGTGYWLGWAGPLAIADPLETHIHANAFGFLALMFAGLLLEVTPAMAGRPLAWPRAAGLIWPLMTVGAWGLTFGPWIGALWLIMPGLLLHLIATALLLATVIRTLTRAGVTWSPGLLHLTTAYVWFLAPVVVAPLVMTGRLPGSAAAIEQSAPQALIFGWALQLAYALIPYLLTQYGRSAGPATLGGSWLTLSAMHLGAVSLWAGILIEAAQPQLHGLAYLLWAASLPLMLWQGWRIVAGRGTGPAGSPELKQ